MAQSPIEQVRAVLTKSYAAISGPAGARDWPAHERFYTPDARLFVVHRDGAADRVEALTHADYRDTRGPFFEKHDFWETETRCDVIIEGDLAVAMSHYESRWAESAPPFETGVNSVQLVRVDGQWKIASIMWTAGAAARRVAAGT